MFPAKLAPSLFGLILSGLMSLLVSGISAHRAVGLVDGYLPLWAGAWLTAWLFAFVSFSLPRRQLEGLPRFSWPTADGLDRGNVGLSLQTFETLSFSLRPSRISGWCLKHPSREPP